MKLEEAIKEVRKAEGTFRFSSMDLVLIRPLTDAAEKWRAMEWYSQNWRSQIEFWMPPTPAHIKDILDAYRKAQEEKK